MKRVILIFIFFCQCTLNNLYSMEYIWPTEEFDQQKADALATNYYELSYYLYKQSDRWTTYPQYSNKGIATWIENKAFGEINVVCLYFFVRNLLEKLSQANLATQRLYKTDIHNCLTAVMLCLQRVTYDIFHHYLQNQNTDIFNAYAVFKKKFNHLLTKYPIFKRLYLSQTPDNAWKEALEKWQRHGFSSIFFTVAQVFPCRWLESFGWAHPTTPGCWGITFGSIPEGKKIDSDLYKTNAYKVYSAMTHTYTTCLNWDAFFYQCDFPLTLDKVNNLLKLTD